MNELVNFKMCELNFELVHVWKMNFPPTISCAKVCKLCIPQCNAFNQTMVAFIIAFYSVGYK